MTSIKEYKLLPYGDEEELTRAVAEVGPIAVVIDADLKSWQFYNAGEEEHSEQHPTQAFTLQSPSRVLPVCRNVACWAVAAVGRILDQMTIL